MSAERCTSEVVLYRCECRHCDAAERELRRVAKEMGARLEVARTEEQGSAYGVPVVCVNGIEVSRYAADPLSWRRALDAVAERRKVAGIIVDWRCQVECSAHGPGLARCPETCVPNPHSPLGLLSNSGKLYRLAQSRDGDISVEELRGSIGERAEVEGEWFRWEWKESLLVRGLRWTGERR